MPPVAIALVVTAAILHASWNALLKTSGDPLRTSTLPALPSFSWSELTRTHVSRFSLTGSGGASAPTVGARQRTSTFQVAPAGPMAATPRSTHQVPGLTVPGR